MGKSLLITLGILFTFANANATTPKLSAERLAIAAFQALQAAKTDENLTEQISKFHEDGFKGEIGSSQAVLLHGQCGFARCDYRLLVTTPFRTVGGNTTTQVVGAIVLANDYRQTAKVKKVLTQEQLKDLRSDE